jgi:hypothetical protein
MSLRQSRLQTKDGKRSDSMNQNNGHNRSVAVVDAIEEETPADETTTFYDSNNPVLKPAKQVVTGKGKSWKRSLLKWCFILVLIGGGAVALYLVTRVNRVPVRVQADAGRDPQRAKSKAEGGNSENKLTAEAITIARQASGNDASVSDNAVPSVSRNSSPVPSLPQVLTSGRSLAFTGNQSPVNEVFMNNGTTGDANQQQTGNLNPSQSKVSEFASSTVAQSHANVTQSISVEDAQFKSPIVQALSPNRTQPGLDKVRAEKAKTPPAVLPPFGTMLPVRTQGVIFTLRNNSYARMELTRGCAGPGWSLSKGTILVGRTTGGEYDRAFVSVIGYIDPRDNKLVKLSGDLLGADGAAGLHGKRIGVDRNRLKQTLRKVASSGVQVAGMMAGALTGRGALVIDGAGYRLMNPITDEARGLVGSGTERNSFVKVQAGQAAYVMVADLPKSQPAIDAPGESELTGAAHALTDREVMELILFGTPEDIRAATPLMSDEQKQLVLKSFTPEAEKR